MSESPLQLDVQRFLKSFKDIEIGITTLTQKFDVNVLCDCLEFSNGDKESVWVLNYDQGKSSGGINLENECRGLILNKDCEIVSMSFARFFNDHEPHATKLDWASANAEFKHDGTLVVVYAYKDNYFIQTRGRANADGPLPGNPSMSYYDATLSILQTFANKRDGDPFGIFKEHNQGQIYTWAFELVGPDNRIITPYEESDLILTGVFNKNMPYEVKSHLVDQFAFTFGIQRPPFTRVPDIHAVHELLDKMNVLEEGVVVTDYLNRRIKVKKPSYRAVTRVEKTVPENLNPGQFADIVLNGEIDYVARYYPIYKPILDVLNEVVEDLMEDLQAIWVLHRHAPNRKSFAEQVKWHPFSHILFMAWDGTIKDMNDALKYVRSKQLVELATEHYPTKFNNSFEAAVRGKVEVHVARSEKEAKTGNVSSEAQDRMV